MTPPALRVIPGALELDSGWSWFCGHCAAAPSEEVSPLARVCPSCGMGLLLETRTEAAPDCDDAFLVVDSRMTVQALSSRAGELLNLIEEDMIDRPVAHVLGAPEAETHGPEDLITLLGAAIAGSDRIHSLSVRPLGAFGVRVVARIAPCGPPRAALVVLGDRAPRRQAFRIV
jgi:hypothetical protein